MINKKKHTLMIWLNIILLIIFCLLTIRVMHYSNGLETFDQTIQQWLRSPITPIKTFWFKAVTFFGSPFTIIIITILIAGVLIHQKKYLYSWWFVINIALGAGLMNKILKLTIQRERPTLAHLVTENGFSFPSGHAMGSMICYGSIIYLIYQLMASKKLRMIFIILLASLILTIGISRIYLGVHFPSDILAGFSFGLFWLFISIIVLDTWQAHHGGPNHVSKCPNL